MHKHFFRLDIKAWPEQGTPVTMVTDTEVESTDFKPRFLNILLCLPSFNAEWQPYSGKNNNSTTTTASTTAAAAAAALTTTTTITTTLKNSNTSFQF